MTANETTAAATIEHAIGPAGSLSLVLASWDAEVIGGAGDVVRVRALSGVLPEGLEVERGPDSLAIRQPTTFRLGGMIVHRDDAVKLGIEVPAGASVDIQTASGDVSLRNLVRSQNVRSASGDIRISSAAGAVAVETMSGDAEIDLAGPATIRARSVSGDLTIRGGRADDVSITTTSGDIRLLSALGRGPHSIATVSGDAEVAASGAGLRVTAKTVAGDVRTRLPHTTEGRAGRRTIIVGDGRVEVEFKSVSGDLEVLGQPDAARDVARPPAVGAPPPQPPDPPAPPLPVVPHDASAPSEAARIDEPSEAARLAILQALERGEIDIAEAGARLAALDGTADE